MWVVSDWILPGLRLIRKFPSPCGVWVVSAMAKHSSVSEGFRPLAGCGLFRRCSACATHSMQSFRPLAGCGLFPISDCMMGVLSLFPSPCGVWVVSILLSATLSSSSFRPLAGCGLFPVRIQQGHRLQEFPSPCGVWVVSECAGKHGHQKGFRPLAGCGLFLRLTIDNRAKSGFRPLAGCGLFLILLRLV